MKTLKKNLSVFVVFCALVGLAQTNSYIPATRQEVVDAYKQGYSWLINTQSYSFKLRYSSFKDHSSSEKIESSEGYYKRVNNNVISEVLGIKTIQVGKWKTIVDTSDKTVTVMNSGNLKPSMTSKEELEELLNSTKSLKKKKLEKSVIYRIEFNKNELYDAYEFILNNKGIIEEIRYYYAEQAAKDYDDNNLSGRSISLSPRLEIKFFGFEIPAKYSDYEFRQNCIDLKAKEEISLTGIYKDYRLLDYRLSTHK